LPAFVALFEGGDESCHKPPRGILGTENNVLLGSVFARQFFFRQAQEPIAEAISMTLHELPRRKSMLLAETFLGEDKVAIKIIAKK
jgi:hypothetical protein